MTDRLTRDAVAIWNAGVDAVRGDSLVERSLAIVRNKLCISDLAQSELTQCDLTKVDRLLVLGGGKAAAGMADGLERFWSQHAPQRIRLEGWLHAPQGSFDESPQASSRRRIHLYAAREAGSNEPSARGVEGTEKMLRLAQEADSRTLVLCLISGGASALLPAPLPGITLEDKLAVTRHLSSRGVNIEELNEVRRCLSRIKGGGLARAASRAQRVVTLVLSDVLGDPLHLIGSGPTILEPPPDAALALRLLERWDPEKSLPVSVWNSLAQQVDATEKLAVEKQCPVETFVLANNATAVDAAGTQGVEFGYAYWMESSRSSEGDVSVVAEKLMRGLIHAWEEGQPDCLISGGEPTVVLPPAEKRGLGGRNQQLALTLLSMLQQHPNESIRRCRGISIVIGGTDGEDGPTHAAGAIVNEEIMARAVSLQLDPSKYLDRCDAYRFFEQAGGLLISGPTGTNVCDLRVILVRPPM